jgi:hypothetical protein
LGHKSETIGESQTTGSTSIRADGELEKQLSAFLQQFVKDNPNY